MVDFDKVVNDSNYMKIASKVTLKYSKLLSKEELDQCKYIGIWKACKNYNDAKSILGTYIYNNIRWECLKQITFNKKFVYETITESTKDSSTLFQDLSNILNEDELSLLKDRFLLNKTIKEIASDKNISVDRINNRITKILKRVKQVLSN